MRTIWLACTALALVCCAAAAGADQCNSIPAHDVVAVTDEGSYSNPEGVGGGPSQPDCKWAYVVDFVSPQRRMSSFVPDKRWIKESLAGVSCYETCKDQSLNKYHATLELFRCTSPDDCAENRYDDRVGSFSVTYRKVIFENDCAPSLDEGSTIPTVRDAYGVRVVLRYRIWLGRLNQRGDCETYQTHLPLNLTFNVSGSAGFLSVGPDAGGKRPDAEPVDP